MIPARHHLQQFIGVCIGVSVFLSGSTAQEISPRTASVEGVVLDAVSGEPLPGVLVTGPIPPRPPRPVGQPMISLSQNPLANPASGRPETTSRTDGTFTLEQLDSGSVSVGFSRPGYLSQHFLYTLVAGGRLRLAPIRLSPSGVISGRVFDDRGQPMVTVQINAYVSIKAGDAEVLEIRGTTASNDRGEFRLIDLLPERYFIGFAPPRNPAAPPGAERWSVEATDLSRWGPVLYPGVGSTGEAELLTVESGSDIRLKDVVMAATPRLGAVRIQLRRPAGTAVANPKFWLIEATRNRITGKGMVMISEAAPPYLGVESCDSIPRPMSCSGQLKLVQFSAGGTETRSYWPTAPGTIAVGVRWLGASGKMEQVVRWIDFTGDDVDVPLILASPEGRIEIGGTIQEQDGTFAPLSDGFLRLCLAGTPCRRDHRPTATSVFGTRNVFWRCVPAGKAFGNRASQHPAGGVCRRQARLVGSLSRCGAAHDLSANLDAHLAGELVSGNRNIDHRGNECDKTGRNHNLHRAACGQQLSHSSFEVPRSAEWNQGGESVREKTSAV